LENVEFLRSYGAYKELKASMEDTYRAAVAALLPRLDRQQLDRFKQERQSDPFYNSSEVQSLLL
jgi:hypothetical protein